MKKLGGLMSEKCLSTLKLYTSNYVPNNEEEEFKRKLSLALVWVWQAQKKGAAPSPDSSAVWQS